jgi:hypothetical protein
MANTKKVSPAKNVKKAPARPKKAAAKKTLPPVVSRSAAFLPNPPAGGGAVNQPGPQKLPPKTGCCSGDHHSVSFGRFFWGVLILLIGLLYLGQNWGILPFTINLTFNEVWPFLVIFIGLCFLNRRSKMAILIGVVGAAAFVLVAVFLIVFANNKYDYTIDISMPALRHVEKVKTNLVPVATDSLKLDNIMANQVVSSPLAIQGQAKGAWFFEGIFPIRIIDENKVELGRVQAKAVGDWMSSDFVSFTADLTFKNTTSTQGILIFERDNPSGLPQNAEQYMVPVNFK